MTPMTDLLTKLIQTEKALEYMEKLNRNNYGQSTRFGWGFTSVDGDERVKFIKAMIFSEKISLVYQINDICGFPYKPIDN